MMELVLGTASVRNSAACPQPSALRLRLCALQSSLLVVCDCMAARLAGVRDGPAVLGADLARAAA